MVTRIYRYKFPTREGLILQMNDGFGEIAPLPGFSNETLGEAMDEILNSSKPKLPSVQFGLACASKPLSLAPLRIPLCALNQPRPDCSTLKLKLGALSLDAALALVKKHLGRYRLRLDFNRAWSLAQILRFAEHFSPTDFEYLEEPVNSYPDLVHFSTLTRFPIAADESLRSGSYRKIPTLVAAIVKPTLMGAIPHIPDIPLVLSSSYESSLGILQIARLATSSIPQGLDTFEDDLLTPPLRVEKGCLVWDGSTTNPIDFSKLCQIH